MAERKVDKWPEFRALRADEVECRVAKISLGKDGQPRGLTLLLYKNARCDMNMLDETVGPMNWERSHSRENANCTISIWDAEKEQWICKEDTGTESNTEAEKGLASDSFKRAGFCWGIGRELYTAPLIWVDAHNADIKSVGQKFACYDRFSVKSMEVANGKITQLTIVNDSKKGIEVFGFGGKASTVKCADCGKAITPVKKRDGTMWAADEMAGYSKGMFGRPLCGDCMKAEQKRRSSSAEKQFALTSEGITSE